MPSEFKNMTNQLQICNWLVKHPRILKLSYEMLSMSISSTSSTSVSTSPSEASPTVSADEVNRNIFIDDVLNK